MFISHTPTNLPVSTANVAAESIANEASLKPRIPEAPPTNPSSNSKHSTDFSEQNKPNLLDSLIQDKTIKEQTENSGEESTSDQKDDSTPENVSQTASNVSDLDQAEQQQVAQLQARDREVRAHEAAHASVGGSLTGSPNLNFTSGPDGKRYATSGDVSIDISKVANDPSATIAKLQQVQSAALAPAQPSSQDRKVAAIASAGISDAQVELSLERLENSKQASESQSESKPEKQSDVKSDNEALNPVKALRESRALEQKIEDSGALENQSPLNQLSLIA
ncbi:MAG: catalase [Gammaproteobacteria bacterium]|nr:MAG: catalase [Gammaproteobacteria bacterium]